MAEYYTIQWDDGIVRMIDQRILPQEVKYLEYRDAGSVADGIKDMVIRGAPAIGAAAGFGLALTAWRSKSLTGADFLKELEAAGHTLKSARPTAVNLGWAVDRILKIVNNAQTQDVEKLREAVVEEAKKLAEEDVAINRAMGQVALQVIPENANIIHHCNTGALATVGHGTALGAIRSAHEAGRNVFVYVDETRPRLQGARLTTWELAQLGIPYTLIADGASGSFMRQGKIDLCLVGCDRVAANGDTANKIGTYNLSLAAGAHNIPFYVVGPTSTVDLALSSGDLIPIENRSSEEVTHIQGVPITLEGANASNPAFDITPASCITAIITERGIAYPPFMESLKELCTML